MGLQKYQAKRRFASTPEPRGEPLSRSGPLRFVVQKHRASRLHFDLRLEAGQVLKSWAVPKGPPVKDEKRLAMMVEDHPLDYLLFEGTIPAGNYGAGTVMVWDTGTYHFPNITDRNSCEQGVLDGLKAGQFHVVLHGRKLRGEFILVHPKRGEENAWLWFIKEVVAQVETGDADRSVLSNRTLDEIARDAPPGQYLSDSLDQTGFVKAPRPRNLIPMMASPAEAPFDDPNWIFEIKWDGYRAIAEVENDRAHLFSRNRLSFDDHYEPIVQALEHLGHEAILDGEIVVLDRQGKPQFQLLQGYRSSKQGTLVYKVFDLLYLDGFDLRKLPLVRRKELLARLLRYLPNILVSEHIEEHGKTFFEAVSARQLEGIVAKDGRSTYQAGARNKSWLKIKTRRRMKAVIGAFTEQKGTRQGFGALLLGVYEDDRLVYIGHVGTGFKEKDLLDLRARFTSLEQKSCPFATRPKVNGVAHWLQPKLVCEVSFGDWTKDEQLWHPVFHGLCENTEPQTIGREHPVKEESQEPANPAPVIHHAEPSKQNAERLIIDGHTVQLTNLKKVYWPEEGYTKGELIHYYRLAAPFILPYLKDRPQSLHRHPNGIAGKHFFQKDVRRQPPPVWVQTAEMTTEEREKIQVVLCQDEATLVYLANLGCIELNPLNARIGSLDRPDYVLLDLDPEDVAFERVVETAQEARKILEGLDVPVYCKTSGKRGLHLYIPFAAQYGHDQAKDFALLIARLVNAKLPEFTSLVRDPAQRQGRVYLDFMQNGQGKTLASVYCARPIKGASVSTPLKWTEVKRGLDPARFTIHTMQRRFEAVGDIWRGVLGPGVNLQECLERLANRMQRERSKG